MITVRQVRAFEGEVIEVKWTCKNGTVYYQRITIPPKNTREYNREKEHSDDVDKNA